MASHQLAIAKASFSAGLLRPDPVSVSRDEISHFHALVNSVAGQCSSTNIQNCKRWILRNVIQSTIRFTAFGKYLTALSISFSGPAKASASNTLQREPSGKRKRLHLLYLVNDLLHHAKFHVHDASVASKVQPLLVGLLSSAASFGNNPKHYRKIEELLDIWEHRNYYSTDYIDKLREAVKNAHEIEQSTEAGQSLDRTGGVHVEPKPPRSAPFVIPAIHGDQGTPWYDLPAGNLMPHITPNSTRPINPALVKPLRFVAGPADEDLARAVKNLLQDVNNIFGITQFQDQHETISWDIDELGQPTLHDEITGEALTGEGYYGWSKAFCEKMKKRRESLEYALLERRNERRSRSTSRSRSQNSSPSNHRYKRRRFSNSDEERSRGRSKNSSRHGRRAYSSSRSRSRDRSVSSKRNKHSRTSRESKPRSTSQERNGRDAFDNANSLPNTAREPSWSSNSYGQDVHSSSILQQNFLSPPGHNFGSGVIPIPPPPPPQYLGQWPPQPPPPPSITPYAQQAHPSGSWPPPPPPFLQNWSSASYGQTPTGPTLQHGGNSKGPYGGRGRGGGGPAPPQNYQGVGFGYNGYRGNGRGNGRS